MVSAAIAFLAEIPSVLSMIGAMTILWFVLWNWKFTAPDFAWNYDRFLRDKEHWRALTACVTHLHILHLLFNMVSLYYSAPMEVLLGSLRFYKWTFWMMCLEAALMLAGEHILITTWPQRFERMRHAYTLGFSGVVFGWMAVISVIGPNASASMFGAFDVPRWVVPWVSLFITQFLIPNASFQGHFWGMMAGYICASGVIEMVLDTDDTFYWYVLSWALCHFVWNVKKHSTSPYVGWLTIELDADEDGDGGGNGNGRNGVMELQPPVMVNGVLQRPQRIALPAMPRMHAANERAERASAAAQARADRAARRGAGPAAAAGGAAEGGEGGAQGGEDAVAVAGGEPGADNNV